MGKFNKRLEQLSLPKDAQIKLPTGPVSGYVFFGSLWILFSDQLVGSMGLSREAMTQLSLYKGWLFIAVTAVLLYLLILKDYSQMNRLNQDLSDKNNALIASNEEIHALYEEMAASEEALHESFSELQAYRYRLEDSDERYRLVLRASQEGFWDYRIAESTTEVSEGLCRILGFSESDRELVASSLLDRIHPEDRGRIEWMNNLASMSRDIQTDTVRVLNAEGNYRWIQSNALIVKNTDDQPVRIIGAIKDIHSEILQQERIEYYAFHDPATGFFNRDYLTDTIRKQIHANESELSPITVLVVGIPTIGKINSIYGRVISEVLHYQVGMALRSVFLPLEHIGVLSVGRFGILIQEVGAWEMIYGCINQLEEMLREPIWVNQVDISVSLAFGLSTARGSDVDAKTLLQEAETALEYAEEHPGERRIVEFEPRMQTDKEYLGKVERNMKRAIENGEFRVVFQPQFYNCLSSAIRHCEALIRWNSPELGNVSPEVFIPIAEAEGFIEGIGQFVIMESCRFIAAYQEKKKMPIRVAINASLLEVMNGRYLERLIAHTQTWNIDPSLIAIEMTETVISKHLDLLNDRLQALRDAGFEVYLDDFGTGYSSLNHLGRLPINMMKIDRSFVWEMQKTSRLGVIVELIIQAAHQLDMVVCAEGVETAVQYRMLQGMGCDLYQGYYFAKPLSEEQMYEFNWRAEGLIEG